MMLPWVLPAESIVRPDPLAAPRIKTLPPWFGVETNVLAPSDMIR